MLTNCVDGVVLMDYWQCAKENFSVLMDYFMYVWMSIFEVLFDRVRVESMCFAVPMDLSEHVMKSISEVLLDIVRIATMCFAVPMDKMLHGLEGTVQVLTNKVWVFLKCFSVLMDKLVQTFFLILELLNGAAAALLVIIVHLESTAAFQRIFEEKSKRALFFQKVEERKGGEEEEQEEKEEERKQGVTTPPLVSILVQGVDGRHLSVKVATGRRVSALCVDLSKMTGIPMDAFYLIRQVKVLQNEDELWLEMDERLCMRGRLRGGMDGAWTCQHCGRQGCWVTKVWCYRCGKSKFDPPNQQSMDGNPNVLGWIRTQARQQTEREWAQATWGEAGGWIWDRWAEQVRKDEQEQLAATQVEIEQIPIPEDVDGHGG